MAMRGIVSALKRQYEQALDEALREVKAMAEEDAVLIEENDRLIAALGDRRDRYTDENGK